MLIKNAKIKGFNVLDVRVNTHNAFLMIIYKFVNQLKEHLKIMLVFKFWKKINRDKFYLDTLK